MLGREIAKQYEPRWRCRVDLRSVGFSNDDNDAGCISKLGTEILENDIIVE